MEIKLTVGFDEEALKVLNRLAIALKDINTQPAPAMAEPVAEAKPAPVEEPAPEVNPTQGTAPETASAVTDACPSEPEVKTYTLEEIRSRVMALSRTSPEVKAKVKDALNKYAKSVPTLNPEDYAAFMADLEAIG